VIFGILFLIFSSFYQLFRWQSQILGEKIDVFLYLPNCRILM